MERTRIRARDFALQPRAAPAVVMEESSTTLGLPSSEPWAGPHALLTRQTPVETLNCAPHARGQPAELGLAHAIDGQGTRIAGWIGSPQLASLRDARYTWECCPTSSSKRPPCCWLGRQDGMKGKGPLSWVLTISVTGNPYRFIERA